MLPRLGLSCVLWLGLWSSACHHIKSDYSGYLEKHRASPPLPRVGIPAGYHITETTLKHRLDVRSARAGYGNIWIIELGEMLEQTMLSSEVRELFMGLHDEAPSAPGYVVAFELVDYQVSGFSAHLTLRIALRHDGVALVDRVYAADGAGQAGKVIGAGAFAMRHALHATTKNAVDTVLRQFLLDAQRALRGSILASDGTRRVLDPSHP